MPVVNDQIRFRMTLVNGKDINGPIIGPAITLVEDWGIVAKWGIAVDGSSGLEFIMSKWNQREGLGPGIRQVLHNNAPTSVSDPKSGHKWFIVRVNEKGERLGAASGGRREGVKKNPYSELMRLPLSPTDLIKRKEKPGK